MLSVHQVLPNLNPTLGIQVSDPSAVGLTLASTFVIPGRREAANPEPSNPGL